MYPRHTNRMVATRFGTSPSHSHGGNVLPTISSISSGTPAATTATITWTTDIASDSTVEYGLTAAYGSIETVATMVNSHSVALADLTTATTYHYRVRSAYTNGQYVYSADQTFVTA